MKIILIGFMGSGKSYHAKRLSKLLGLHLIDTDSFIEEKQKRSVKDIFKNNGEPYFRLLEKNVLLKLDKSEDFILSTGGGMPCYEDNVKRLKQIGISVWLNASVECIYSNLKDKRKKRPLLKHKSEVEMKDYIQKMLSQREPYYSQADITISFNKRIHTQTIIEEIDKYEHSK